ncbi:MAG TPA: Ig-like domain-containing protein, partial [Clostridia bacterium]|nr:Ig-like domain-containing protein [Clostridia bacterium]
MKIGIRRKIILLFTVAVMMLILLPVTALAGVGSTQTLDNTWSSDTTNGFLAASASTTIDYDTTYGNAIYVNTNSASGQWIEFEASSAEGLFSFDLSSLTVYRGSSGGEMTFEVVGTKTGGSTVTENLSWPLDGTEVKTFSFSALNGITKFRVNMNGFVTWCADFVSFTISNQVNNGNASPVISNLSDAAFQENTVNVAAQQLDADISVSDTDSADFSGGKVTVSYTGTGLTEDRLSVGNIGNISVSGTTVSYSGVGSIGTVSGGGSGSSLVITLGENATPARTIDILRAICYADASDEPASYRTVSITVSDGDGATSNAVTAVISVTGEADNGSVESPGTVNDLKADWLDDLNNYFSIVSNDAAWSLTGDASLVWLDDGSINVGTGPASLTISAAEQFDGGMFDLTKILFDLDTSASGKTFTVTVTGHQAGGTQITDSTTISTTGSNAMNLSGMTGLTSFDVRIEGSVDLSFLSLDSFTIANPQVANILPSVTGVTTPASGSTDVSVDTNIVIQFSESLDTATIGTVTLNGTSYTNGGNATISISGSTVTVNPTNDFAYDTKYTGLSVSGFKDTEGSQMTVFTDSSYNFTTLQPPQLTTPTGLAWDGTMPGKATWSTVSNAASYIVQLYKGGTAQGSPVTGVTATEYDFTVTIASAGTGAYTFRVTAVGDGSSYTNSVESAASAVYSYTAPSSPVQLTTPTGLAWDGTIPGKATWNTVSNVTSYTVQLYKGGTAQSSAVTGVTATEYDFTAAIASEGTGVYTFRVTAVGDGSSYTNSAESAASVAYSYTAPPSPVQLDAPAGLAWNGTMPGKATWNTVSNAASYIVQLYKGGTAQGSPVTGVTATEYDFTAAIASEG